MNEMSRTPEAAEAGPQEIPDDRLTLAAWTYANAEFTGPEVEEIFLKTWQIVCHESEVPDAGSFATFDLGRERAFVMRDRDGTLRAFHNVCRHRAHPLVEGDTGRCKGRITCPYHGWTYGLDGGLRLIPTEETFPGIDKSRLGLKEVELATWQGFVFVRFRKGGEDLETFLGIDPDEVAPYRFPELEPYRPVWELEIACDWKNAMDNYLESYHVAIGHPGLHDLVGRNDGGYLEIRDERSKRWSVGLYQALLPRFDHLPDHLQRVWRYFSKLPNLAFDVYPEMMDFFQVLPGGPGRTIIRSGAYCLPDDRREAKAARWLCERINGQVQDEDNDFTVKVQRGLETSAYDGGWLSTREEGVNALHALVRDALPVARLRHAPARGTVAEVNAEMGGR